MSPLTRLAEELDVPPQELKNLATLLGLAAASGAGLFVARGEIPLLKTFANIRALEFSLAYVLLGLLPVLFVRATTTEGKAVVVFLFSSLAIGLLAGPQFDSINLVVSLLVLFGGFTYFGVSVSASNRELVLAVLVLLGQGYLYMMLYVWTVFQRPGHFRISILSFVYLTGTMYVVGRFLWKEYREAAAGSGLQA